MTRDEKPDALFSALGELASLPPAAARDARIRARCHAVMTRRARRGWSSDLPAVAGRHRARVVDALLLAAVGLYGIASVAEALKVVGIL